MTSLRLWACTFQQALSGILPMLNPNETKVLIEEALSVTSESARNVVFEILAENGKKEIEFLLSLIEYSDQLQLNSEQWFKLLSIFQARILFDDLKIMSKLSENQRERLAQLR